MQLIIDIGNTRLKAALFDKQTVVQNFVFDYQEEFLNADLFSKHTIEHCIIASVVDGIEGFAAELQKKVPVLVFTSETKVPVKNLYYTIHSLGSDRLAAAVGGNLLFPDKNCLVIDAGTCIKYNFVNNKNEYIGGAISPGLRMRFKAMNTFTSRLPLVETDNDFETIIGTNSRDSILSGVELGAVAEITGFIEQYHRLFPDIYVILTGGDVNFFANQLKKPIFANRNSILSKLIVPIALEPLLILKGLNSILTYNIAISGT